MPALSSRIFIDGKEVDYLSGTLTKEGGNTAARLNFTLPGKDVTLRKYWGKEVTFFMDKSDAYPMFRGFIENLELLDNSSLSCRALDSMGYLTGLDRSAVTLDEYHNVDGSTIGGALKEMINMAGLTQVGTDFIGDTDPITLVGRLRGKLYILDTITGILSNVYNSANYKNFLKIIDDGTKGQLIIDTEVNADNEDNIHTFDYLDNMIFFNVQDRKIPTIITVEGGNEARTTFKHESAVEAFGENPLSIANTKLTTRAACYDFAQEIFLANLKAKYEYSLSATNGYYLEENDVVRIIDDNSLVNGKFRIIGKTITFGNGQLSLDLTINKQPPLLSRFLKS